LLKEVLDTFSNQNSVVVTHVYCNRDVLFIFIKFETAVSQTFQ